jgi:undecaprenyl-diphosphatase
MSVMDLVGAKVLTLWGTARREIGPLMLLGAILIGGWCFVELADAVGDGEIAAFDEAVLTWLRTPAELATPIGPLWLKQVARDVTALGGWTIGLAVTAFAIGYLLLTGERRLALYVGVAVCGGTGLSQVLKDVYNRPRPALVPHLVEVSTASFPSGHAMGSTVVWLTLAALMARSHTQRRVKSYLLGCATTVVITVGLTRIYLGVHWPSDVLSGWTAGVTWALGCWLVARLLDRRRAPPSQPSMPSPEPSPEPSPLPSPEPSGPSSGMASTNAGTAGARSRSLNE